MRSAAARRCCAMRTFELALCFTANSLCLRCCFRLKKEYAVILVSESLGKISFVLVVDVNWNTIAEKLVRPVSSRA